MTSSTQPSAIPGQRRPSTQLEGRSIPPLVLALFLTTGMSGLMLEVVWSRMLGWLLGATTWSVMTILVAFMGGLGLGGLLLGQRAALTTRPLRLFGLMEIAIGLYTLAVPALFGALGRMFVLALQVTGESPFAAIGLRVVTSVLALAIPTILMGGTLPVLTAFVAAGRSQPGRSAGQLYAANTAGAVIGCLLTGCVLVFRLGVVDTNLLAGFLDLGVGIVALAWDRQRGGGLAVSRVAAAAPAPSSHTSAWAVLSVATLSGFCGLAYEVLWTRGLLAAMTDDTTYAFTLMLTAFLAGHAAGAAVACGRGAGREPGRAWLSLGRAQILAALAALVSFPFLVLIRDPINRAWFVESMSFWGQRIPFHLAISVAVFAPSAFFLGMSFAQAARLFVGAGRSVGSSIGWLYGLNTLGSVAGAIVTTAWLIPGLGSQRALVVLALSQAALGVIILLFAAARPAGARGRIPSALAWVLLVGLACGLNWLYPLASIYARHEPGRLLALVEGSGAAVTVHQRGPTERVISINGVNVAGTNPVLRATQKLQAHLPLCLHREPRSVLQIGFGSGGTCYAVSLHPEITAIDVVELNPDVLEVASRWFADINQGVLRDPRVTARIADAKSYAAATGRTYDLILSDSTHPRFRGNAALYARDYFADCARRLRPGGIFSTWLPLYGLSVEDVRGILKSFQSVFPHVQVWYANSEPHENTLILASQSPIAIDPEFLTERLSAPAVAADLAEVGITSTIQMLDFFLLGDRAVAEFSRTGMLNTDDHPTLEYMAPRSLRRKQSWVDNFAALRLAREPIEPYLVNVSPTRKAQLDRWYAGTTQKLAGQSFELESRAAEALQAYTEGARLNPEDLIAQVRLERFRKALSAGQGPGGQPPGTSSP